MAKMTEIHREKFQLHLQSLIDLNKEFKKDDFEISEALISWLQVDIQGLKIVAEGMEIEYYG